jgi:hypothetical protein
LAHRAVKSSERTRLLPGCRGGESVAELGEYIIGDRAHMRIIWECGLDNDRGRLLEDENWRHIGLLPAARANVNSLSPKPYDSAGDIGVTRMS